MIAMKLGWLVLEGILLGAFLYFGNVLALAMAGLLVFLPVCSIFLNLYVRRRCKVRINAEVNLRKGDSGTCEIILENPTIFPVFRVRCKILAQNQLNREMQKINLMTWLIPKKQQTCAVSVGSDYCGRLRVEVQQVILYDCFGLVGIPCKCDVVAHVTVQPDTFEMAVTLIPGIHSIEDSEIYSQNRLGMDLSETFQIRE